MENKFLKSWLNLEEKYPIPRRLRNFIKMDWQEFEDRIYNQSDADVKFFTESLYAGDVFIAQKAFKKEFLEEMIRRAFIFGRTTQVGFKPMIDNSPDFHVVIDEEESKKFNYNACRHSYFFFPWNQDPIGVWEETMKKWRVFKFVGGFDKYAYENAVPSRDLIIDRLQIIQYPSGGGGLESHIDPRHNQRMFLGAFMSKRGVGYKEGGIYIMNDQKEKVDVEPLVDIGDMICGYPTVVHGVNPIDPGTKLDWNTPNGRWFLALYSNDSNYVQNRKTVQRLDQYTLEPIPNVPNPQ